MELLTPVDLGPVRLMNRVVSTSHQTGLVHDHLPTPDLVAYHEARARGGVGAIFLEATAVDPSGLLTSHTLGGFLPAMVGGYRGLCSSIHPFMERSLTTLGLTCADFAPFAMRASRSTASGSNPG